MRVQVKSAHPERGTNANYPRRSDAKRAKMVAGLFRHCEQHPNDTLSAARLVRIKSGADR